MSSNQSLEAHLLAGCITERLLSMDRSISRILDTPRDEVQQCVHQTVADINEELTKQE